MDSVEPVKPQQSNALGIISLVSGILCVFFAFCCSYLGMVLGLVAIICGIIANTNKQKFALAGIILGAVGLILAIIALVLLSAISPQLEDYLDDYLRNLDIYY